MQRMNKVVQENNRYLIYELLGRNVEIRLSARQGGQRLKGVVDKVCRDIFENMVKVTVSGQIHEFQEPSAIVNSDGDIHFLYGDIVEDVEIEDEEFQVPENAQEQVAKQGGSINFV
jgi:hypothetical protein